MHTPTKSANINSATGRRPARAAPAAEPTIADSLIGVSITRPADSGQHPLGYPKDAARGLALARGATGTSRDILAEYDYTRIPRHLLVECLVDGDAHGNLGHRS